MPATGPAIPHERSSTRMPSRTLVMATLLEVTLDRETIVTSMDSRDQWTCDLAPCDLAAFDLRGLPRRHRHRHDPRAGAGVAARCVRRRHRRTSPDRRRVQ